MYVSMSYQSTSYFVNFHKMGILDVADAVILDARKSLSITFLATSDQYATFICMIFLQNGNCFTFLDARKSLSIAFLTISHQYAIYFSKLFSGGHYGCPKITFDSISRHFRSIDVFFKMPPQPFFLQILNTSRQEDHSQSIVSHGEDLHAASTPNHKSNLFSFDQRKCAHIPVAADEFV